MRRGRPRPLRCHSPGVGVAGNIAGLNRKLPVLLVEDAAAVALGPVAVEAAACKGSRGIGVVVDSAAVAVGGRVALESATRKGSAESRKNTKSVVGKLPSKIFQNGINHLMAAMDELEEQEAGK